MLHVKWNIIGKKMCISIKLAHEMKILYCHQKHHNKHVTMQPRWLAMPFACNVWKLSEHIQHWQYDVGTAEKGHWHTVHIEIWQYYTRQPFQQTITIQQDLRSSLYLKTEPWYILLSKQTAITKMITFIVMWVARGHLGAEKMPISSSCL